MLLCNVNWSKNVGLQKCWAAVVVRLLICLSSWQIKPAHCYFFSYSVCIVFDILHNYNKLCSSQFAAFSLRYFHLTDADVRCVVCGCSLEYSLDKITVSGHNHVIIKWTNNAT
jgi:hypothetical protein